MERNAATINLHIGCPGQGFRVAIVLMQCLVSGECLPIARMLSVLLVHVSVTVTSARHRKACDAGDPTQG